jgi:hypothetical protein
MAAKKPLVTRTPASAKKSRSMTTPEGGPEEVAAFLASLDEATRADCAKIAEWMRRATGDAGIMYGKAIVGFGTTTVQYAGGRQAPWMKMGFSPRKQALALYGLLGASPGALLEKLGKHATGKGCLYVKRLADVDAKTLKAIIEQAAAR